MLESYWADLLDPKDPLLSIRKKGWDRFVEIGLPRPKQEAFQYLVKKLTFPQLAERGVCSGQRAGITFVDGFFEETLSQVPAEIVCLPFDLALRSYALFLQNRLARVFKEEKDPFAALNGAFQGKACFLYLPPKCKAALHLNQIFTKEEMVSPRLHIYLGKGASLELRQKSEGKSGFSNALIDLVLDEGASVNFYDHHVGDFQAIRATLKRDSKLKVVYVGEVFRQSIHIELMEENAEAEVLGLARLTGEQEQHIHANLEHKAPHTRSRQHFKTVLYDKSRFSFEGKIYVHPEAQKTESYQLNNNLILSDEASTNAKPNLEIFADDVKASHGATIGKLDEEHLFYLRSRGLSLEEARKWLVDGFCKEISDHAK